MSLLLRSPRSAFRVLPQVVAVACMTVPSWTLQAAPLLPSDYMLGVWTFDRTAIDGHYGALAFFSNGTYIHAEVGPNEVTGFPGMEVGTYTFAPASATSGTVSFTTLKDTNGDWGASGDTVTFSFFNIGGRKCFIGESEPVCTPSTTAPVSLATGWTAGAGVFGDVSLLAFFESGRYIHAIDPPSTATLETGDYSWNESSGALALANVHKYGDTDPTLSDLGSLRASISGTELSIVGTAGSAAFAAVPLSTVPEPSPISLLAPLALLAALRRTPKATGTSLSSHCPKSAA